MFAGPGIVYQSVLLFSDLRQRLEAQVVREAGLRGPDGGVLRRLPLSVRHLQAARGVLLCGDRWRLGVLRPPQLQGAPVPPGAGRVPAARRLGGVLARCGLLPPDNGVLTLMRPLK